MALDAISPGVYTKIIDLSQYLSSTSGVTGFVPVITEKGRDNVLVRVTSYQEYMEEFGEPDIRIFGKYYGCGPYIAEQHLSVSSDLYVVRALPDDATYAHTFIYFSSVDDYPRVHKFAKNYEDVICDEGAAIDIPLWDIAVSTSTFDASTVKADAIEVNAAFDGDLRPTNVEDAVVYTSDTKFANYESATPLYAVEIGRPATETDPEVPSKQLDALEDETCDCYDSAGKKVELTGEEDDDQKQELASTVAWCTSKDYIQEGKTEATWYVPGTETYGEPVKVAHFEHEPTTSKGDFDVGYRKVYGDLTNWYAGKHTSLSAISVIPGMTYGVQSDVTCEQQTFTMLDAFLIAEDKKESALKVRRGYTADGILAFDTDSMVYTDRVEFAAQPESGDPQTVDGVQLKVLTYKSDKLPWYVLDQTKAKQAIADYDAFDKNGWLTTDPEAALYCGYPQYAEVDSEGQRKEEKEVALKKPVTTRFVVDGENLLFTMDRSKEQLFLRNAKIAIAKAAAWDKEGYPAISPEDVYVTSIQEFAVKSKTPKMNNTQMLDSLFYGNDAMILGCIANANGDQIYSKDKRLPHNCMLGYVRAVGRGSYYNSYSIKITSDANPAAFGTYKFQVFEYQDGAEVLCESFNVSFDPTALDADGETMYWVDVINKFSDRVVVDANDGAIDLFQKEMTEFYQNDPTIVDIATDATFTWTGNIPDREKGGDNVKQVTVELPLVGGFPSVIPTFVTDETDENFDKIIHADLNAEVDLIKAEMEELADTDEDLAAAKAFKCGYKAHTIWEAYYAKAWAQKATFDATREYNAALEMDDQSIERTIALDKAIQKLNTAQLMTQDAEALFTWAGSRNLMNMNDSDSVTAGEQTFYLENGSLGSLVTSKGLVDAKVGDQILSFAYTGLLKNPVIVKNVDESTGTIKYKQQYTDNVYDTDWIYFTMVYDPGYKPDVKQAALDLVDTYRRDCVLISDCGDNADYEDCLKYVGYVKGAADCRIWNTYLAARYEPYSRVYDKFIAKDIWVSPVYHMAKVIPQTCALYDLWYAAAGFTRGVCSDIKELRYSPNKAQRDLLYMAQVNPIVHFPEGMTVWGMLTTQKKTSSLSDLPTVMMVLYVKRALEQYCRSFIFEINDQATWDSIYRGIAPLLDTIVARNGLKSYSIEVGATEYELKTKTCHVNVTLEPMKILEKIELNLYIK